MIEPKVKRSIAAARCHRPAEHLWCVFLSTLAKIVAHSLTIYHSSLNIVPTVINNVSILPLSTYNLITEHLEAWCSAECHSCWWRTTANRILFIRVKSEVGCISRNHYLGGQVDLVWVPEYHWPNWSIVHIIVLSNLDFIRSRYLSKTHMIICIKLFIIILLRQAMPSWWFPFLQNNSWSEAETVIESEE